MYDVYTWVADGFFPWQQMHECVRELGTIPMERLEHALACFPRARSVTVQGTILGGELSALESLAVRLRGRGEHLTRWVFCCGFCMQHRVTGG
jgi:hypothetical protein